MAMRSRQFSRNCSNHVCISILFSQHKANQACLIQCIRCHFIFTLYKNYQRSTGFKLNCQYNGLDVDSEHDELVCLMGFWYASTTIKSLSGR